MRNKESKRHFDPAREPVSMVGPYARVRVIIAVIIFLIAIVALGVRALSG